MTALTTDNGSRRRIDLDVDVHHLTRVEGHANIQVRVRHGELVEARWEVVETPRFFEVMLRGKHYTTAPILAARICGICSIAHCLVSARATEQAFGLTVPDAARRLRLLAKHGETLQSHALHLFFLAAPDFLGLDSAIPLLEQKPELFALAAALRGAGNRICDAVAGRTTHPVSIKVGGMARRPDKAVLLELRALLRTLPEKLDQTATLFAGLDLPDFVRETEHVSLRSDDSDPHPYPWIGGALVSSDGVQKPEADYRAMTNEYVVPDNTSKWCKLSRESMAVGPLARFNNNQAALDPRARQLARDLDLQPIFHNPFAQNLARVVEMVHLTHQSLQLIDELLDTPQDAPLCAEVLPRAGEGVGAVEAPRGILYHRYEYDEQGRVVAADCVIPTTQNNANIHYDLRALVQQSVTPEMTDERLELLCSMLVRAYDPCISCSVH